MMERISEAILGMFHKLSYQLVILNSSESAQVEYREVTGVNHIPRKGEIIGVPMQSCDRHSKGTSYLTAIEVSYSRRGLPRVIVDKSELRRTTPPAPNPLERKAC